MNKIDKEDRIAKKGCVWVCSSCGKYGKDRNNIGDVSCFLRAVLCTKSSLEIKDGLVVKADYVETKKVLAKRLNHKEVT